jgi:hypothetical protein
MGKELPPLPTEEGRGGCLGVGGFREVGWGYNTAWIRRRWQGGRW